jgi:predicted  nucleic acid-binding Zn-ribbon protein
MCGEIENVQREIDQKEEELFALLNKISVLETRLEELRGTAKENVAKFVAEEKTKTPIDYRDL